MRIRLAMHRNILIIILLGFLIRLLFIWTPMVDAFGSMRQTYTAGYTRYMLEEGVQAENITNPKSIVYSHQALELPIYNLLTVPLGKLLGDNDYVYRLTSLILWLLGALYLARMLLRIYSERETLLILTVYTILPLSIFTGHYYHPEILSILLSLFVVFGYHSWLERKKPFDLVLSLIALTIALLVRSSHFYLYFVLIFIGFSRFRWQLFRRVDTYAYLLPLLPMLLWNLLETYLTSNVSYQQFFGPLGFRFSPKYFGMLLFHRLGGLTLSPLGLPLLIAGCVAAVSRSKRALEFAWLYGALLFVFIVARGNFNHPHYQAPLLIPASIVIGRFLHQIALGVDKVEWQSWWKSIPRVVIIAALSIYIFLDVLVLYLYLTKPWDAEEMKVLLKSLDVGLLIGLFLASQVVLLPLLNYLVGSRSPFRSLKPSVLSNLLLLLIFITGVFVISPMYRLDMDHIRAAEALRNSPITKSSDGKIIFAGKKDSADPFIFYSSLRGWSFHLKTFLDKPAGREIIRLDESYTAESKGGLFVLKYMNDGAEYFAVMKKNRYLLPSYERSEEILAKLSWLDVEYEDEYIVVYNLSRDVPPGW